MRLGVQDVQDGLQALRDVLHHGVVPFRGNRVADVVGAGQQNDDFRIHSVHLSVVEPPEDVLDPVRPPAEIGRIPSVEIARPTRQQIGTVGRPPTPRDRIAREIDVDPALLGLFE